MNRLLLAVGAICAAPAAQSDDLGEALKKKFPTAEVRNSDALTFEYENFYLDTEMGRARIILKIENKTAAMLNWVFFECAFLNADMDAVSTATLIARNIAPGSAAYPDGWSERVGGIEHAQCRITKTR